MRRALALAAALALSPALPPSRAATPAPVVAYASNEAGTFDLYTVRLDGTGHRRLTSGLGDETSPSWSPDGKRIAFWSRLAGTSDLAVLDVTTGAVRELRVATHPDDQHHVFPPAWSPRGDWIVFESNRDQPLGGSGTDLYLIRPDGTGLHSLTRDRVLTASPSWSRNGSSVLFAQQFGESQFPELYTQSLTGKRVRLTRDTWHDWEPRWSPDGRLIAFSSTRGTTPQTLTFGVHIRRANGTTYAVAAPHAPALAMSASWVGDGKSLVYVLDPDGPTEPSVGYFGGVDLRVIAGGPQPSELHVVTTDARRDRTLVRGLHSAVTPAVYVRP